MPGHKEPSKIPNSQIENLKFMLGQTEIPVDFSLDKFSTDDKVIVTRGNLKGLVGEVKEIKNDMTILWIAVDLLGGAIIKIKSSDLIKR